MTVNVVESYDSKELILKALKVLNVNLIPLDEFEWDQEPQDVMGSGWNEHLVGEGYPARAKSEKIITINRISQGYPNLAGSTTLLGGIRREELVKLKRNENFAFAHVNVSESEYITFDFYA